MSTSTERMRVKRMRDRVERDLRSRRAIPGFTCGYTVGVVVCAHPRTAHKYDEVDGVSWCDECWSDQLPSFNEISYHAFDQGVYANA